MNWYKIAQTWYKIAQIWMVPLDSFSDYLKALYELEYKYSMLQSHPFSGLPERQQNISQNLEQELSNVIGRIKDILIPTFSKWLGGHAITKPTQWAVARVGDPDEIEAYGTKEKLGSFLHEYQLYAVEGGPQPYNYRSTPSRPSESSILSKVLNDVQKNINRFPSIKRMYEGGLEDYKNIERDNLSSEGFAEYGQRWGKKFRSEEQAEAFIDRLTMRDVGLENILYTEDVDSFVSLIENFGSTASVLTELYKNLVFPAWYQHWEAQGIKDTRKNIENIYRKLQGISTGNIKNAIAVISLALNATHQSGDMLDYVEDDLMDMGSSETKDLLTQLSNSPDIEKWNQELREVGVQI